MLRMRIPISAFDFNCNRNRNIQYKYCVRLLNGNFPRQRNVLSASCRQSLNYHILISPIKWPRRHWAARGKQFQGVNSEMVFFLRSPPYGAHSRTPQNNHKWERQVGSTWLLIHHLIDRPLLNRIRTLIEAQMPIRQNGTANEPPCAAFKQTECVQNILKALFFHTSSTQTHACEYKHIKTITVHKEKSVKICRCINWLSYQLKCLVHYRYWSESFACHCYRTRIILLIHKSTLFIAKLIVF